MSQALFQQLEICQAQRDRAFAERDALQQRLTAQDQREDDLKGLLWEILNSGAIRGLHFDFSVRAALKPTAETESHG
jgi:hypothetical protein